MKKIGIILIALFVMSCKTNNKQNMKKQVKIIEHVTFKIKEGISKEQFINAAEAVNPVVSNHKGYLGRKLAIANNGEEWTDIVFWTDLESAEHAAKEIMKSNICMEFVNMIDEQTMKFEHLEVLVK